MVRAWWGGDAVNPKSPTQRRAEQEAAHYAFLHEVGVCAATGCSGDIHVAHIRFADWIFNKELPGMGRKPHFVWTLPLLAEVHVKQHSGNEREFWDWQGFPHRSLTAGPLTYALAVAGFSMMGDVEGARRYILHRVQETMAR
jgi:hypothetical protein